MKCRVSGGPLARLFILLMATTLAACASGPSGEAMLRPGPQHLPALRAQGDLIIATLQGAAMTVQPLGPEGLDAYYLRRPALINPFKTLPKSTNRPLAFIVRIQNLGRERISFDPSQALLEDQERHRMAVLSYDELYSAFSEGDEPAKALQALEETVLTNYIVIPPKLDREGLLLFPPPQPDAKAFVLELSSFYIGSAEQLLLFEFEVLRPRKAGKVGMFGL
jgi:hypothetical protein